MNKRVFILLFLSLIIFLPSCQDDSEQILEVFHSDLNLASKAGEINIYVKSNIDYTININSDSIWLQHTDTYQDQYHRLTFSYDQNKVLEDRRATITLYNKAGKYKSLDVTQSGIENILFESICKNYTVSAFGDSIEFFAFHDIKFDYRIEAEGDWISSKNEKTIEFNSIIFSCKENETTESRSAKIYFNTLDAGRSDTITIYQDSKSLYAASIKSFIISKNDNFDQLVNDIHCEIDQQRKYIKAFIPYSIDNFCFIPQIYFEGKTLYFTNEKGEKIYVNDDKVFEQAVDFSTLPIFTVVNYKGEEVNYEVFIAYNNNIPVLSIVTENRTPVIEKKEYINGYFHMEGFSHFSNTEGEMRVRGRGNSTWTLPKKPYRLKLDKKQMMGNMPADKDWALLANYTDRTSLRNNVAFKIASLTNLEYTPRMQFCDFYFNGEYLGIYALTEHLKVSGDRINVGKKGYVIEITPYNRIEADEPYFSTKRLHFTFKEPDVEPGTENYNWISEYINNIENILYSSDFADPENGYANYIDVESFVDWYIVNELAKNVDATFFASCFMNIIPGEKLKMGPVWDFDIAFGNCNYNTGESYEGFLIKNATWYNRLFQDPLFVEMVKDRFKKMKANKSFITSYIRFQSLYITKAREEDNNVWKYLGVPVWPNYVVFDSYEKEVQYLIDWINNRFEWLDNALNKL